MKVKNTLTIDKIWQTLPDKMETFTGSRICDADARKYILNNFPKQQYTGIDEFDNVIIWCHAHLGNNFFWDWETFYFKTEQDRVFFLLRWS
jgi:hypothetical protein